MVVPEAMSQQCAVVATPIGAAASLVRDGETGLLVPPRDPDSLSGALLRVLDQRNLRDRLASAAYAFVGHRTWTDVARETLVTYERALGGRGRTRGARAA
jgi:glycosyltransferase involved in cell wall biosynthesis